MDAGWYLILVPCRVLFPPRTGFALTNALGPGPIKMPSLTVTKFTFPSQGFRYTLLWKRRWALDNRAVIREGEHGCHEVSQYTIPASLCFRATALSVERQHNWILRPTFGMRFSRPRRETTSAATTNAIRTFRALPYLSRTIVSLCVGHCAEICK